MQCHFFFSDVVSWLNKKNSKTLKTIQVFKGYKTETLAINGLKNTWHYILTQFKTKSKSYITDVDKKQNKEYLAEKYFKM